MSLNLNTCIFEFKKTLDQFREPILKSWNLKDYSKTLKDKESYVTDWDLKLDKALCEILAQYPWPVLSEESLTCLEGLRPFDKYWLLDPLDGTIEFIEGREDFAVNIALIENKKPIFGFIYHFVSGKCYWSTSYGIRSCDRYNRFEDIFPPSRSAQQNPHDQLNLLSLTLSSRQIEGIAQRKAEIFPPHIKLLLKGASMKYIALVHTQATIYPRFGRCGTWDTAAGDALLRSLGGGIVNWKTLEPLEYSFESYYNSSFIAYRSKQALKIFLDHYSQVLSNL